ETTLAAAFLRALPAGRGVARAERLHFVEARGAVARHAEAAGAARGLRHRDVVGRQLVEEARRHGRAPQAVDAPVGGEIDLGQLSCTSKPDMGEAALLLEPGAAALI